MLILSDFAVCFAVILRFVQPEISGSLKLFDLSTLSLCVTWSIITQFYDNTTYMRLPNLIDD